MSEALIVFKAIGNDSDKQMLLQKALAKKETLYLRDKFDRAIALKPVSINSNNQIKCHHPEDTTMNTNEKDTFTASFSIGGEKYLFETHPVVSEHYVTLTVLNLFHLQRRRNYRYVMPENYSAEFVINYLNQSICSHPCRLIDLSTEGCAVEIMQESANLHLEDLVEAEIFLGDREPIMVQGVIKNIRVKDDTQLVLGVEFNHLANSSEEKIVTSLTDLQREIFFRRKAA
ncbi:hypothetical protein AZI87_02165 [Bdellovibrio bacteriovorus]|uniref:PilZ domain-containing protein n=1 Tax=Bdellovibrio bacteriovorus TaxID=959 RepID=A0A162GGJ3_BDEBC|nr:PilZ domain-containing protein [Bdellovibrio bacteriovorus]KYG68090.1 hypothetical protein AZI87_02165 [Bdellovibrio bacteriovorus]